MYAIIFTVRKSYPQGCKALWRPRRDGPYREGRSLNNAHDNHFQLFKLGLFPLPPLLRSIAICSMRITVIHTRNNARGVLGPITDNDHPDHDWLFLNTIKFFNHICKYNSFL